MSDTVEVPLDAVHPLAMNALTAQGFSGAQADAIATTIAAAEADGCSSHGLFRVPFYLRALQNPDTDPRAVPQLHTRAPAVIAVDAGHGFCPLALRTGLPSLALRAREKGIAAMAINNAYNIAALWPEVEQLANEGLVAMAFTGSSAYVAPAGGARPLFGTNPMAFGWPRPGRAPMVFDQASSVCARGEIQLHLRDGQPIPEGWAIDADGQPTTDPAAALAGAQLPFGGYKGSAIAMMVELLAGALIGDLLSVESSAHDVAGTGAPFGGELLLAIDPTAFGGDGAHYTRAESLFEQLLAQDGARLPGDRRYQRRAQGLPAQIPEALHRELLEAAN